MTIRILAGALLLLGAVGASAQTTVFRCGNEYTRVPCSDGKAIDTQNSATAAQLAEAARVAGRERRLADDMARDRRRAEAEIKPAGAANIGPQKASAPAAKASAVKTKKKPRGKNRDGEGEGEDFVARVPKTTK